MVLVLGMFYPRCDSMSLQKKKVSQGLTCASIKGVQANIQKCIIWPKIFGKAKPA
jgi:hypothetical protein